MFRSETDAPADEPSGGGEPFGILALRLQNAVCAEDDQNSKVSIPAERSGAAFDLGDLLTALSDCAAKLCLRHTHLLAQSGQLLHE